MSRVVRSETRFRSIATDAVRQIAEPVEGFHRFRCLSPEYVDVSTRLCDAQLRACAVEKRGT